MTAAYGYPKDGEPYQVVDGRTLSFAALMNAEPDLAERSEDLVREEFSRRSDNSV